MWPFKELQDMVSYENDTADFTKLNEWLDRQITEYISPKFEEAFKLMTVDGNFPAAAYKSEEKDELLEEVTQKMDEAGDLSEHHEGEEPYIEPSEVDSAAVAEETTTPPPTQDPAPEPIDDLPF